MCEAGSALRLIQSALAQDDQRTLFLLEFALRFVSAMEGEAHARQQPLKEYMQELRLVLMGQAIPRPDKFSWLWDNA